MTLKMAKVAHENERSLPLCRPYGEFDLVDWNKNVAARLAPWPGFEDVGLMENNGHQNYRDWSEMMHYHPYSDAPWVTAQDGVSALGETFYEQSAGIYTPSEHYQALFH